ncbi:MAG TPA: sigma-70 family RNA polymerase sigma factor [Ktedonobacterales bacterium]|jgi:RNA polymerase sigma-70 factor (ECF subfamily)
MRQTHPEAPAATAAFAALLQQTQRPLYAYLRGLMADQEQAHDLVQDVFCDAWRAARQSAPPFDADSDAAGQRRWLFRVAHHKAVSALRHRSVIRWESLDIPGESDEAPDHAAPFEDQIAESQAIHAALASLALEEAACLLLNVVQGFTSAEIAQIIGVSQQTCKKRLARAKQRLRAAYFAQNTGREESQP